MCACVRHKNVCIAVWCVRVCVHVLCACMCVYMSLSLSLSLCVCVCVYCMSSASVWLGVWCTLLQSTENNKLHRQQSRAQPLPCSTSRSACLSCTTTCMYVCKCVMHLINPVLFIYKYVSFGVIILNYTFNPLISSFQSPEIQ